MNLFLLRHGQAAEGDGLDLADDAGRPLTAKGRRQLRETAAAWRAMELRFDLVFSSSLLRAWQTAEVVAKEMSLNRRPAEAAELRPGGGARELIERVAVLKPPPENVLLIGHEPDLSEMVSLLVTGRRGAGFALKKGGLAKLEIEKLRAGKCARLAWLLTPRQMKLMR